MNFIIKTAIAGATAFLLIQLVPYGKDHKNPPILSEPEWSNPEIRQLAKRACFNCHSNETVWPFYASISPVSWLVYHDVAAARKELNYSDWQGGKREGEDYNAIAYQINKGEMPPFGYVLAHPEAKLTADEKKQLSEGLQATVKQSLQ